MKKKAFTLVEIMAVVALIGILFIIVVPRFGFAGDKVKRVGVQTDFHAYETALRTVSLEYGKLTNITSGQISATDKSNSLASAMNEYLDADLRIVANPDGSLSIPKKDPWQSLYGIGFSEVGDALFIYSMGPDAKENQAYDTVPSAAAGDDMIISSRRGTVYLYGFGVNSQGTDGPVIMTGLGIIAGPSKTAYLPGETFVSDGMEVVAIYSDGSESKITGFVITDGANLPAGKSSVTISYVEQGVTVTTTQPIVVGNFLVSIAITKPPTKVNYRTKENFSSIGMVVTATYIDGTKAAVNSYAIVGGTNLVAEKTSVTISYTENGLTKTVTQAITVKAVSLASIAVTKAPTKLNYNVGESFDTTGMIVTATYDDKSTIAVSGYTITDGTNLTAVSKSVTISYSEGGLTRVTSQAIVMTNSLASIKITKQPNKVTYNVGENFNAAGMIVTATYNDKNTKVISEYSITDGMNLIVANRSVTISYTEDGVTKTTTQAITVTPVFLASIAITSAPSKLNYRIGEDFDPTGMIVTATYDNNRTRVISGYNVTNGTNLSAGKGSVTISYSESGITKQATQAITVINPLVQIAITRQPAKTTYIAGEHFNSAGMVVTATYANWTTADVVGFTISDGNNIAMGKTSVTVSYSENGMVKTTTQAITVTNPLASIRVTTNPKMVYEIGEPFDSTGMIVTAVYANGATSLVSGWITDAKSNLPEGNTTIMVYYTENNVTKSISLIVTAERTKTIFTYSNGTTQEVDIVGTLKDSDYTLPHGTMLTGVKISKYVTIIGQSAFYNCTSLTSVTIPNSVTIISDYAFYDCVSLDPFIPNSVTNIGTVAFRNVPHISYAGSAKPFSNEAHLIYFGAKAMN